MNATKWALTRGLSLLWIAVCAAAPWGCKHDVPITGAPTRPVDERTLGVWVSGDGKETMRVARWDEDEYAVFYEGEMYRAFHSDVGQAPFVTIQDLTSDRKYTYMKYRLDEDGRRLILWMVREEVVPEGSSDSALVRHLLEKHAANPDLLGEAVPFVKR